jgi:hypothetical protein
LAIVNLLRSKNGPNFIDDKGYFDMWMKTADGRLVNLDQYGAIEKSVSGWGSQSQVRIAAVRSSSGQPNVEIYAASVESKDCAAHLTGVMQQIEDAIRSGARLLELPNPDPAVIPRGETSGFV